MATDFESYVHKAITFSRDYEYRSNLRKKQRAMMRQCDLCDGKDLARALEAAYLDMWHQRSEECHPGGMSVV